MDKHVNGNWFPVSHEIVESEKFRKMRRGSRILYFYMAKLSNRYFDSGNEGWFHASLRKLAKEAGLNVNSIKTAKDELIEKGFIEARTYKYKPSGKKLASTYRIRTKIG